MWLCVMCYKALSGYKIMKNKNIDAYFDKHVYTVLNIGLVYMLVEF